MDTKNYTQVLIDGKVYTLGGSEDESYLQKAASYVNEKNSAMRKVPGFTKQSADYQMVMTELNIADDYFKAVEWGEGMERQKNDMEKETYSLKHELVSTQMKLEAVLKDLEERQREMDRLNRRTAQLEGELKEARENLQNLRNNPSADTENNAVVQAVEEIKETVDSQDRGVVAAYNADSYSHVVNPYGNMMIDDPVAGPVPSGYCIESMLFFLQLVNRMKDGTALKELEGLYPTGEEAIVSTIMCQYAHMSAETGRILDIEY